jgi:hypothetical protein
MQFAVLADHETTALSGNAVEKLQRAEIAIRQPELLRLECIDYRVQAAQLLRVSVFDWHEVAHCLESGVVNNQRLAR